MRPADGGGVAQHRQSDDAFDEIFGRERRPLVEPRSRRKTDLMPFIDTASPLSLAASGRVMEERGPMLPSGGGRWEDGTFASTLRAPEPVQPSGKMHDPEVMPPP